MKLRAVVLSLLAFACAQSPQKPALAPAAATASEAVRRYDFLMGAGRAGGGR
jgi:hypothetical protein